MSKRSEREHGITLMALGSCAGALGSMSLRHQDGFALVIALLGTGVVAYHVWRYVVRKLLKKQC